MTNKINTTRIVVIGAGEAGNNMINRLVETGMEGADIVAVDTDTRDLLYTYAKKKVLIGRELTGGLGAAAGEAQQWLAH